ncbi:MAG: STAS domain-containing protein [Magnetospiraceae bacterium]
MTELTIRVSQSDGSVPITVLHVAGDLDADTYQDLDAKATEATDGGAQNIILDLSGINYMSSAGFRSVHLIYMAVKGSPGPGPHLRLVCPTESTQRMMKTMGFDTYIPVHKEMREAVDAFA